MSARRETDDGLREQYERNGFVVLHDVLDAARIDALRSALQPYLDLQIEGRNDFEGVRTRRVYSLVGRGAIFERTVEEPRVLDLLDELLLPGYLLTASQAICIGPGESPQPIHFDDQFYTIPRPRPPVSISTIWALDDFTAHNGGTEVIPGSHRWGDEAVSDVRPLDSTTAPEPREREAHEHEGETYEGPRTSRDDASRDATLAEQLVPVEMGAGSLVVFSGTLLHRGGANSTQGVRRAFSHQYCEPWARQQENFMLSVPGERTQRMSPRLRQLMGYSIHPPFMGQLAGRHPEKSLADDYVNSLVADDERIAARSRE